MASGRVFLMYHEIEVPGRAMCQDEPGYVRYVVREAEFRHQIARLKSAGSHGMSVSEAMSDEAARPGVAITFDDGCETDITVAAPVLKEAGFNATFYVVAGFIGQSGYLSPNQLRRLNDHGFEIGCHSMTHAFLPALDGRAMEIEMSAAKGRIEQLIGKRVDHFSCPGGRWSPAVARVARAVGYLSVATSRIGTNPRSAAKYCLARVAVMRGTAPAEFERRFRGEGFAGLKARHALLGAAKGALGDMHYEWLRALVLRAG